LGIHNHHLIAGYEVSVTFITGQVIIDLLGQAIGSDVTWYACADPYREVNVHRLNVAAYQDVVNPGTLALRDMRSRTFVCSSYGSAGPPIFEPPFVSTLAVTPLINSPAAIPVEVTFRSIPSFLAPPIFSTPSALLVEVLAVSPASALLTEAFLFPTASALLTEPLLFSATAFLTEPFLLSAPTTLLIKPFLPIRSLLASLRPFATASIGV